MAKTVVIYAGGNTEYQFPFDYLRKEFVKVSLVAANGTPTAKVYGSDYTVTDRKITLKVASDATGEVRIWRSTTTNPITVFSDASVLRARTLNALDTQLLHIAEENSDAISMYGMSFDNADNTWQGMGRIIKNVKNPLNPQDAVTLNYLDSVGVARGAQMEALAAQITADKSNSEAAAAAALVSEKNAKTSETNAKVSETASKNSETNAKVSETTSKTSETNAKTSEENSKTSETNAKTSEENSKTSETNAKVYMDACSNGAGYTKVEMDALLKKKGGVPIGTITGRLSKKPEAGELAVDTGSLVSRAAYPDLWTWVQINAPLLSEADWQAQSAVQTSVGAYSTGDGSTTFRLPRLLDYMRGGVVADVGTWQDSDNKSHQHGAMLTNVANPLYGKKNVASVTNTTFSAVNLTATEVTLTEASGGIEARPKTIKVLYCVKAFDAETNPGLVDVTALANEVAKKQSTIKYAIIKETQPSGANGGTFTAGAWRTRTLNTVQYDTIGLSLLGNQIVLPAGVYKINAICPAHCVENHKARLQNITDNQTLILGTSHRSASQNSIQTQSFVSGVITIIDGKTIELQHYSQSTQATTGFGNATNISGINEVYSTIEIIKVG